MSGHSKWHNIQVKKGKADKQKSGHFTKAARAITVAAREGGADPAANFSLRLAIDKAKAVNMPKDNIERAIARGTGALEDGAQMESALYEGFGPGGAAFMVEAITDNKNRTVSEIKNAFAKHGGSLAGPGSVQWQFARRGVVRIGGKILDFRLKIGDFELRLIDAGAEDMIESNDGLEVYSSVEKFQNVIEAVQSMGLEPDESGLEWVAKETVALDHAAKENVEKLAEALEEMDDVRAVYTNARAIV